MSSILSLLPQLPRAVLWAEGSAWWTSGLGWGLFCQADSSKWVHGACANEQQRYRQWFPSTGGHTGNVLSGSALWCHAWGTWQESGDRAAQMQQMGEMHSLRGLQEPAPSRGSVCLCCRATAAVAAGKVTPRTALECSLTALVWQLLHQGLFQDCWLREEGS